MLSPHTSENMLTTGHTVKAVLVQATTIFLLPSSLLLLQMAA